MKKIFIFLTLCLLFLFTFNSKVKADTYYNYNSDLDYIESYDVTVTPNNDGSLHIDVDLVWKVLDDTSDGPLSWIKVGTPNYHVSNMVKRTSNIYNIEYYSDGGSFIRIDLDRNYYRGSTLNISYSYDQSYMYHISTSEIYYDYHPGYFNDILVGNATLKWKIDRNVVFDETVCDSTKWSVDGDYYKYSSSLLYGQYISIRTKYNITSFDSIDPEKTYTDDYLTPKEVVTIIVILTLIILGFIAICLYAYSQRDRYLTERGFYGRYRPYYFYGRYSRYRRSPGVHRQGHAIVTPTSVNGGGFSGDGGGFSCACACACAGGGRAGCSRKDFYQGKVSVDKTKKELDK